MSERIRTSINNFTLRFATEDDVDTILQFIRKLAEYEKLSHEITADHDTLHHSLFKRKVAEVVLAEYEGEEVGFMLFFYNFSTFIGKPGIYLEDLYINDDMRNKGFGKVMLSYLALQTIERDCGRLEWACLDWNQPSISFYKSLQAEAMDNWTGYRLTGKALKKLSAQFV